MADQETNVTNFYETTLDAQMGPNDLTAVVPTTTGVTSPCYMVIDPDDNAKREVILFDGTFTATTLVTTTINNRYLIGSAQPSNITHDAGAVVRYTPVAQLFEDLNDRIDADFLDFDGTHRGSDEPAEHPYAGTAATGGFMSNTDKTKLDGIDAGAQADHAGLTGLTADNHHLEDHAARHAPAGADPLAGGADPTAVHVGTAAELSAITAVGAIADADIGVLEDASNADAKAKWTYAQLFTWWRDKVVGHVDVSPILPYDTGNQTRTQGAGYSDLFVGSVAVPSAWLSMNGVVAVNFTLEKPGGNAENTTLDVIGYVYNGAVEIQINLFANIMAGVSDPTNNIRHQVAILFPFTGFAPRPGPLFDFRLSARCEGGIGETLNLNDVSGYGQAIRAG